jgi:probable F420-dependent oxidoreductase
VKIKIGFQAVPWYGEVKAMRAGWVKAEELGADAIYTSDHFFAQLMTPEQGDAKYAPVAPGQNFEGMVLEAAIAATTSRVEIGCLVHAIGFRNPNLLADMARTIDHISGGRFILGVGAGYQEDEYLEYGYDNFGTMKTRLDDLDSGLRIIKDRLGKLNPSPLRKMPVLVGSMGEKLGMRIVAEHADMWHVYGKTDVIAHKIELMKTMCAEIGRDFSEIEMTTWYSPDVLSQANPLDDYVQMGIRNIITPTLGPDWDTGVLRELLEWRKTVSG